MNAPDPAINELLPKQDLKNLGRRARKKQETRWRIYTAAIELMKEHGFDSVKIEDICERADASNPAFFHHFSNKEAVISTFIEELKFEIRQRLSTQQNLTAREKLFFIAKQISELTKGGTKIAPQVFKLVTMGDPKHDLANSRAGISGALTDIIEQGQSAGEFNQGWHPEMVASMLVSSWLVLPIVAEESDIPREPYADAMALLLNGLDKR